MAILSIQLGHNATVGLLNDTGICGVLSQEKVDNIKNSSAFPKEATTVLLKECGISAADITCIVICGNYIRSNFLRDSAESFRDYKPGFFRRVMRPVKGKIIKSWLGSFYYTARYKFLMRSQPQRDKEIVQKLSDIGLSTKNIYHVDHHTCHAFAAAFYFDDARHKRLIFTLDGEGDDRSGSIWFKSGQQMSLIAELPIDCSLGHLYTGVTKFLGMTPLEHEYKVMGLAAYSKDKYVTPAFERLFKNRIRVLEKGNAYTIDCDFDTTQSEEYLKQESYGIRFDNLAGAVQRLTEEIVLEWIEKNIKRLGVSDIAVSGGVFMNVKLNKRIQESHFVSSVKFLPSCGDESNVIGALYYYQSHRLKQAVAPLEQMYLGISFDNNDIEIFLQDTQLSGIHVRKERDINQVVAELLAERHIVARAGGKNEWGARSLGNRAILAHPSYMESFYTINDLIKARDFWMPFAPSILDVDASDYLEDYDEEKSYPYAMITSYLASPKGVNELRAGIHQGDHTCRPQIVTQQRSPDYYDLLRKFKTCTGIGGILNTSLNIHGYPLAASLEQIFFTYQKSGLNYLALGDYLLVKHD
jgi:carbamoyltransferase